LLDRQITRVGTLQDFSGVTAELTKHARKPGSVADQAASRDGFAPLIDRWDPIACR
jgi:hypothetical protein